MIYILRKVIICSNDGVLGYSPCVINSLIAKVMNSPNSLIAKVMNSLYSESYEFAIWRRL